MFYSNQILARKGPLGLVWIAAHMDKQLKRQQINAASIPASVDSLLDPEVPLALRLSGQLMLGVVRIYGRKVAYLQQDCNDALVKIRGALRPGEGGQVVAPAPLEAVTALHPAEAAAARSALARRAKKAAATGDDGGDDGVAGRDTGAAEAELLWGYDGCFAWEQEVLLGTADGSDLLLGGFGLPGFHAEPGNSARLSLGLSGGNRSGLASQDVSSLFGMAGSSQAEQEAFDAEDEEAAALWDLDDLEVERLRAAPSGSQPGGSSGMGGLLGRGGDSDADAAGGKRGGTPAASDSGYGGAAGGAGGGEYDSDAFADDADHAGPPAAAAATPISGGQRQPGGAASLAAADGDDLMDLDFGDADGLASLLPDTPTAAAGADAGDGQQPAKTFQRRKPGAADEAAEARAAAADADYAADQGATEEADDDEEEAEEAAARAVAARAARKRRTAALFGRKRPMVVDVAEVAETAGARGSRAGGGTRLRPATELPAAEVRSLLADRAPLLDPHRAERASQQLLASASGAAATLLAQQQQQLVAAGAATASQAPAAAAAGGLSGLPNLGLSLASGFAGSLGLPLELQQLFATAASGAAPAAAAGARGGSGRQAGAHDSTRAAAAAAAPVAALEELDGGMDLDGGFAGAPPRVSLSLSLAGGTPGSAAQQQQQQAPPSGGFSDGGHAGYSDGSLPPNAATPGYDGEEAFDDGDGGFDLGGAADDEDDGKENAAPFAAAKEGRGGAPHSTTPAGVRLPWPADAETLAEADGEVPEASDGGFTARTRLVMRHLQAAAAAAGGAGGDAPTPIGSKRRFSAAALAPLPQLADGGSKGGAAHAAGAGAAGPVLSFEALTASHGRLDACRWFYEVLVLTNKGFVGVQQHEAYGDIAVTPNLPAITRV